MSGYAVSKKSEFSKKRAQVPVLKRSKSQLASTARVKELKPLSTATEVSNNKNIPTLYKAINVGDISANGLLIQNNPSSYSPEYYQKALSELKLGLKIIGVFLILVYVGWAAAVKTNTTDNGGLIYNTGLIGGSLMLVALLYSVVKKIRSLHRVLSSEVWYYLHIGCGAVGAYLVLLHSSFDLRSINASIGLITTLIVIISGALGRYLYTLSTISLHRQLLIVKDTEQDLFNLTEKYERERAFRMRERLARFTLHCFKKPQSRLRYLAQWISILYFGVHYYMGSKRDLRKIAKNMSKVTRLKKRDIAILSRYQKKKLQQYILHTTKMGYTRLVEQVLRHWRLLHIPALYLLTLTAIAHVVVVHMY